MEKILEKSGKVGTMRDILAKTGVLDKRRIKFEKEK